MTHLVRTILLFLGILTPVAVRAQTPAPAPQSITLEPGQPFVLSGRESWRQLLVTGRDAGGKMSDLSRAVKYEAMPAGIVAVDASGLVTPLKEGKATLHARLGGLTAAVEAVVQDIDEERPIHFENQIVPIFTRFGCNAGGCHGKAGGQNGFQLSLLGFEPKEDYEYIVKEARGGRRLLPSSPEHSFLLTKATGTVAHGGGKKLDIDSAYYRLMLRWIAQGAPPGRANDPVVTRLEVLPRERVLARGGEQQLSVLAHHSDGSVVDVTRLAQFEPNHPELAEVSNTGLVAAKKLPGSVAIMARFQTHIAVFQALIPLGAPVAQLPKPANFVDDHVFGQLQRLGVPPSDACSDSTFVRRVTLDIAGRLPTLEETQAYLDDKAKNKDAMLIDRLLASEDYAYYFAGKWGTILRNRRTSPTDDAKPTIAFHAWIKDALHQNKPFDQFARDILTATGEDTAVPPIVWYRELKEPAAQVEDIAQLFLGQRVGCAKCHHHPFEKWTQDDYWSMVACFSQLDIKVPPANKKNKDNTRPPVQVSHKPGKAQAMNPRTKKAVKPAGLGGPTLALDAADDPRAKLADWLVAPENPFFARTLVNRYWKHFFKIGLVEPEDDLRVTNPPSNAPLLDALAQHFLSSKYDLKALVRVICNSQAYRRGAVPNEHNATDKQNFSHFYLRRLHAEVLFDAIDTVTGSTSTFKGLPEGTRAVQLPDNQFQSYFLSIFGRPESTSPCECERGSDATLVQSVYMFNAEDLLDKIGGRSKVSAPAADPKGKTPPKNNPKQPDTTVVTKVTGGRIAQLVKDKRPDEEKVRELYLIALSRAPRADELRTVLAYLESRRADPAAAYADVLWAVINTKEFLFNH